MNSETKLYRHWSIYWRQIQQSLNLIWKVHTKEGWNQNTSYLIICPNQNIQVMISENRKQFQLLKLWQKIWRWQNLLWVVKTKETKTLKDYTWTIWLLFVCLFNHSKENNIGDIGTTSLSDNLKINTTLTELELCREKTKKRNNTQIA